jgi:hypothetical protein
MEYEADSRLPEHDDDGDSDWVSTMDAGWDALVEEFVDIEHTPFGSYGFPDQSDANTDYIDYDKVKVTGCDAILDWQQSSYPQRR